MKITDVTKILAKAKFDPNDPVMRLLIDTANVGYINIRLFELASENIKNPMPSNYQMMMSLLVVAQYLNQEVKPDASIEEQDPRVGGIG